ncbi:thermosome subunit 1 [Halalkalicoccus paucihalophilus]|uniref:Thermosome subunit 1 n=2 Tax=Halalkalicoccus paucihalophilus TaxID=1008153 RepID=A0A151AFI2_9EURY|nr:thermosome subunit 1 [Halalkalicoccus paucihalophilus]
MCEPRNRTGESMNHGQIGLTRLNGELHRLRDRDAQEFTIDAGIAVADLVRTTLGPNGLDKMLVDSGRIVVTNDGASILDRMGIDHPTAKVFVETAASQNARVGDGTTTAVIVAAELLRNATGLLDRGIHPTAITNGYQLASKHATATLAANAIEVDRDDTDTLERTVQTAVTGKWDRDAAARFAALTVRAVRSVEGGGKAGLDRLTLKAFPGGSLADAELVEGLAIDLGSSSTTLVSPDAELPTVFEDARIALIDDQLTIETADAVSRVSIDSPDDRTAFTEYEESIYSEYVTDLVDAGVDVVFCQKSIDEPVRSLLANAGIVPVERTRQDELHKLARTTGAEPVQSTDELGPRSVGRATTVERRPINTTELIVVRTPAAEHRSLILRGGTVHVAEETKRIVETCIRSLVALLEESAVVPGGGAPEIELAYRLRSYADGVDGREQFAVGAFADALESVPRTLASTAGMDPIDTILALRTEHDRGNQYDGIDVESRRIGDLAEKRVFDPLRVRQRALVNATEAANTLLRVDDVIAASRSAEGHGHDHGTSSDSGGYPWAIGH